MGCRPIQSEVINYAPIGFNSRSRAPDLICVGSFGLFSPLLPLQNVLKGLGSSAKSQSTKHLRPNGDGRQKQAKRNQRSNLYDDNRERRGNIVHLLCWSQAVCTMSK